MQPRERTARRESLPRTTSPSERAVSAAGGDFVSKALTFPFLSSLLHSSPFWKPWNTGCGASRMLRAPSQLPGFPGRRLRWRLSEGHQLGVNTWAGTGVALGTGGASGSTKPGPAPQEPRGTRGAAELPHRASGPDSVPRPQLGVRGGRPGRQKGFTADAALCLRQVLMASQHLGLQAPLRRGTERPPPHPLQNTYQLHSP